MCCFWSLKPKNLPIAENLCWLLWRVFHHCWNRQLKYPWHHHRPELRRRLRQYLRWGRHSAKFQNQNFVLKLLKHFLLFGQKLFFRRQSVQCGLVFCHKISKRFCHHRHSEQKHRRILWSQKFFHCHKLFLHLLKLSFYRRGFEVLSVFPIVFPRFFAYMHWQRHRRQWQKLYYRQ